MVTRKIALIGNPNTGKSSVFNHLTGLNQQVGNFPGITVDKKTGQAKLSDDVSATILDLPGTYSVFPRSKDEKVVYDVLSNKQHPDHPELVVVVADASNLERNLLLFTQINDLGLPTVLLLTMTDLAQSKGIRLDLQGLGAALGVPVFQVNGRTGMGVESFKLGLATYREFQRKHEFGKRPLVELAGNIAAQAQDAQERFEVLRSLLSNLSGDARKIQSRDKTKRLDKVFVHPVFGYLTFLTILLVIFQFIFQIASYPMDWIDGAFVQFSQWTKGVMPEGVFTNLIAEGVIPGIGGVVVFVPQIAMLFFFLALLEESGYMARVVFIMDKLVRPFGLNGKSVVPLMSSAACAIPGIMAARNIGNWKERITTIMVAPLMSCSARIPVYTLLIALVVPDKLLWGVFNYKGLVLFMLYAIGLVSALLVAWVMKFLIKSEQKSFLIMEMPDYRWPRWKQVGITLFEKVRIFVMDAGKIILAISIVLWALASYGPSERIERAVAAVPVPAVETVEAVAAYESEVAAVRLENSYIGIVGHAIEPAIRPLGYDWKIGISLITSFAAREVFVGSMAAIYSVGEDFEEGSGLIDRMAAEMDPDTGKPVYNLASGMSLMIFYVYAMQCMATFAIVKRETKSWKWPLIQVVYMAALAYISAFLVYHMLK